MISVLFCWPEDYVEMQDLQGCNPLISLSLDP